MLNSNTKEKFFFPANQKTQFNIISIKKNRVILNQQFALPGSKSMTNRALILAGMHAKPLQFHGILYAEDSYWGLLALENLGFHIDLSHSTHSVQITPPRLEKEGEQPQSHKTSSLFLGKAGTLARFFPAIILNWQRTFPNSNPIKVILDGEEQLRQRPLAELVLALRRLGGHISSTCLPLTISSSPLAGECEISGHVSGQFLSGLLLAASGAKSKIKISRREKLVQPGYIEITIKMIEEFGGKIQANHDLSEFHVLPVDSSHISKSISPQDYHIEADASTACYFICLAYLHNFTLKITNLGKNTLQPDYNLVYLLKKTGANIITLELETHIIKKETHQKINLPSQIDCSLYSDQALTIGILALFAQHPVEVFGINHIRNHESNRIACLVKNLTGLGCKAFEKEDGFIIYPIEKSLLEISGLWETYHDHRFAMCGFLLASLCPNLKITQAHVVEKTAPQFFNQVQTLGFETIYHQ